MTYKVDLFKERCWVATDLISSKIDRWIDQFLENFLAAASTLRLDKDTIFLRYFLWNFDIMLIKKLVILNLHFKINNLWI